MQKLTVILLLSSYGYVTASDSKLSTDQSKTTPITTKTTPHNDTDESDYEDGEEAVKGNPKAIRPKSAKPCNHENCFPIIIHTLFDTGKPTIACLSGGQNSSSTKN